MTLFYNQTERKPLVKALEKATGKKAVYLGTPSYAYAVDYFTVTRDGNITCEDMADTDAVQTIRTALELCGFHAKRCEYDNPEPDIEIDEPIEDCPPAYGNPDRDADLLAISLPRAMFTDGQIENLKKLVCAKAPLLKEALAASDLPVAVSDETISFPWFSQDADAESYKAYGELITSLCKMAREAKRVTAKEKEATNPKYEFRCFLLRLGFIGDEYKASRKILLKNLSGSSAFKGGANNAVSE